MSINLIPLELSPTELYRRLERISFLEDNIGYYDYDSPCHGRVGDHLDRLVELLAEADSHEIKPSHFLSRILPHVVALEGIAAELETLV